MILYVVIGLILFISVALSSPKVHALNSKGKIIYKRTITSGSFMQFTAWMVYIFICILTAFRAENIGNDTHNYVYYFDFVANRGVTTDLTFEIGYQYYSLLLSKIFNDPHFFLIVTAILCYWIIGIKICQKSQDVCFSILLFFCLFFSVYTNILRQGIAMAITLVAYYKLKEGGKKQAIILIIFASLFHYAALCMLALFLYPFVPYKPKVVISGCLVIVALSVSGITRSLLTTIFERYAGYFDSYEQLSGWLAITYELVRSIVFYLLFYYAYKHKMNENRLECANVTLLIVMTSLGFVINIFSRAALYYLLPVIIELPNALSLGRLKNKKLLTIILGSVMVAYFIIVLYLRPDWNHLYPYEFWGQ